MFYQHQQVRSTHEALARRMQSCDFTAHLCFEPELHILHYVTYCDWPLFRQGEAVSLASLSCAPIWWTWSRTSCSWLASVKMRFSARALCSSVSAGMSRRSFPAWKASSNCETWKRDDHVLQKINGAHARMMSMITGRSRKEEASESLECKMVHCMDCMGHFD